MKLYENCARQTKLLGIKLSAKDTLPLHVSPKISTPHPYPHLKAAFPIFHIAILLYPIQKALSYKFDKVFDTPLYYTLHAFIQYSCMNKIMIVNFYNHWRLE